MVRTAGIEPASQAWEAHILPIYYARLKMVDYIDPKGNHSSSRIYEV